ncbi:MAG: acylneuraminate cytidylyltransferase [Sporolactobacillus sp.]|jgi:spore coat polysaccharide biosynthesis protein SpsF|nr:acylneuraminate cytidylyltransferase [Sporolactobacillus sp.]
MKTIIIIQARIGSSRLRGKILKPLAGLDDLTYVVERCKRITPVVKLIVATSVEPQDDRVEAWCAAHRIDCFRGSEADVLDRYVQAAQPYHPDYVIRVTADCPFVDYELANAMIRRMAEKRVDIFDLEPGIPRGLPVEIISYGALLYIHRYGHEHRHREHVTYYAYEYKDCFSRNIFPLPANRRAPELRITLDTEKDYRLLKAVAEHFRDPLVSSVDVIRFLKMHPEIAKLNADVKQKPVV